MTDNKRVTPVVSETTGTEGRSLNHARSNHYVVDEPQWAGGPGEAVSPEESFLTGVSACGVSLVESRAEDRGYPLTRAEATIRGIRDPETPEQYERVEMEFVLGGVDPPEAQELVEYYQGR